MPLDTYKHKRNFARTPEPSGDENTGQAHSSNRVGAYGRFVVQEHHASHLHYDFRLEMDGVLKSWAVPKGPPKDYKTKRLAIMVEDHPVSYIDFSGVIPEGNYGAGTVAIWDSGTYESWTGTDALAGIEKGKIEIVLHGDKLDGKYDLVRINEERREWLMIRSHGVDRNGHSNGHSNGHAHNGAGVRYGRSHATKMPSIETIQPMLAIKLDRPFNDSEWIFEIKWDGYRALVSIDDGKSRLVSRNHISLDKGFPEFENLQDSFKCTSAIVDGEIVALTDNGLPHFQALQNRMHWPQKGRSNSGTVSENGHYQIVFMAFDLLYLDGHDLTLLPLIERRRKLSAIIQPNSLARFSDHIEGEGEDLFTHLRELGVEGMMAKRADSPYIQDRSPLWAKIKYTQTQDVVIAGFTETESERRPFSSLLMGEYDKDGNLIPVGHVGTGFDSAAMKAIHDSLRSLETERSPFATPMHVNAKAHWTKPEMVAEVRYAEVTSDGSLRQPVFIRMRSDKNAAECRLPNEAGAESVGGSNADPEAEPTHEAPNAKNGSAEMAQNSLVVLNPDSTEKDASVEIDGRTLKLTNLPKLFWPRTKTTKRDLLRYYSDVADVMIPHLIGRPIVIQRYPGGVESKSFFQHDIGADPPTFLKTFDIVESSGLVHYALCDELADLLYLANLGAIPIHTWNVKTDHPESPDRIVFDIDPQTKDSDTDKARADGWSAAIQVGQAVKGILEKIGLQGFPKTSGSRGLHVTVPILPNHTSDEVVEFARLIGKLVTHELPDLATTERRIEKRGKTLVYFDCMQNGVGKTVVAPYSLRARPTPTVSCPLKWDELTSGLNPAEFTIDTVPQRLKQFGDLMQAALDRKAAADIVVGISKIDDEYGEKAKKDEKEVK